MSWISPDPDVGSGGPPSGVTIGSIADHVAGAVSTVPLDGGVYVANVAGVVGPPAWLDALGQIVLPGVYRLNLLLLPSGPGFITATLAGLYGLLGVGDGVTSSLLPVTFDCMTTHMANGDPSPASRIAVSHVVAYNNPDVFPRFTAGDFNTAVTAGPLHARIQYSISRLVF